MFKSILGSELTLVNFLICIGVAFVLGLIVALIHKKTTRTTGNFVTTLAILPTLVAMAILLVNGNLGAGVATVGVFSLIRFRSIPGNSRSLLAVFFAMAIGLAVGTGYVVYAALFTVIIGAASASVIQHIRSATCCISLCQKILITLKSLTTSLINTRSLTIFKKLKLPIWVAYLS